MDDNKGVKATRVTLKIVADHVGLTAGTISAVLNNTRAAERIPQQTRERIFTAARELNYQPNPLARALRTGQAFMTGTDACEIGNGRGALVIVNAEQFMRAMEAMQRAGLRVPDDVSVVDMGAYPAALFSPQTFASAAKPT
ncbi:MAG: LacI family DNA-binding transcriptional regulator [Acidobacteria bacterium]|nr:LacI family DNA-binding transcriptional regulator [Acidobacteriota bacterium]